MAAVVRRLRTWGPPAALLVALVLAWQAWVTWRDTEPYVLPSPARIGGALVDAAGLLTTHSGTTLLEAIAGLAAGAAAGVALAVLVATVPLARRTLEPLLVASQTIPMIVLAPLLVLGFGFGLTPKIVVVALVSFFPVVVSTVAGLRSADRDLLDLVRSMGADRRQVLRMVLAPGALPSFFAGLRIAAAYAVAGAVIGEYVGGSRGLGIFITRSQASFRTDRIFAAVAVVAFLSVALFAAVDLIARLTMPWQRDRS
jgi:putative hydroxymethylpyrimidine transport system permease protein